MVITPPGTHLTPGVIGENALSRPYATYKEFSVFVTAEVTMLHALFIDDVVFINLRAGIDNGYQAKPLLVKIFYHVGRIRKLLCVPGKVTIAIHIIDVEPNRIAGMIAFAEASGNLAYLFF